MDYCSIVDKLAVQKKLSYESYRVLLSEGTDSETAYLMERANNVRHAVYGNSVYIRGLIEISNYCRNDCLYCGIRRSNKKAERYRLSADEISGCVKHGYELGFRTFVLQGGEDAFFTDEVLCRIISSIKHDYPDCAVTLSLGERSYESYKAMYDAGADRYLLRHETACREHYMRLHPASMSYDNRIKCLHELKQIGYQTGCGMMVGSPYQTIDNLVEDILFIQRLQPEMVGLGPFIPHKDTVFANEKAGTVVLTLKLLSIMRIMNPLVLLPATTALASISPNGREAGIRAGANVVMPNLSPPSARDRYRLYNNKANTGQEAAEGLAELSSNMNKIGYSVVFERGDPAGWVMH